MRKEIVLTPSIIKILSTMGEQIKLARLRRHLTQSLVASRARISRPTLVKIEHGAPDVAIGSYIKVLQGIGGLQEDFLLIAKDDATGRTYQDLRLITPKRGRS